MKKIELSYYEELFSTYPLEKVKLEKDWWLSQFNIYGWKLSSHGFMEKINSRINDLLK